jgi:hypothetical protein
MDLEESIVNTLCEYQFGDNLENGDYITGVREIYFGEVAKIISNCVSRELERRRDLILSEPDGIVREQMINNLAID